MEPADRIPASQEPAAFDGVRLAASFIWHDRKLLLPLFAMLLLPTILESAVQIESVSALLLMLVMQRAVQLTFLLIISQRWVNRLRINSQPLSVDIAVRFFVIGFLAWFFLIAPLLLQFVNADDQIRMTGIVLIIPVIFVWLRYYFYFIPIVCGVSSWREILRFSHSITQRNWKAPLYTLSAPLGIVALMSGIIYAPAPDGRLIELQYMASATAELFWPLCCYLSLAFGLSMTGEMDWRALRLEPYRTERFETLMVGMPEPLAIILRPRNGVKLLLVAALIWVANKIQLETTPPAVSVTVLEAGMDNDSVKVVLELKDEKYHFHGFQPINFVLAGENRHLVSTQIESIESKSGDKALRFEIPDDLSKITMTLVFRANRSGEALRNLKDLYLWYRLTKVAKIDLSSSPPPDTTSPAPDGASP